jgi:hypothetical protein
MNKYSILAAILLSTELCFAAANKQQPIRKLEIVGETILTDDNGVVIPKQVLQLTTGHLIKIKRADGFEYLGVVTETEEAEGLLKIYGVMTNTKKTNFGFVIAKGGQFVGAIIDEAKKETYVMEFIEAAKGFIFVREITETKPGA